mgnify:CR=1 FL=1
MFSLMRNLRRSLIESNSMGKYILYAFGEVVLIVVGILAALWIDNWNQERQEAKREQFYLSGLKEEFGISLLKLDTLIAVNRHSYQTSEELLRQIPGAASPEDEATLSGMLIEALSYGIAYNPNNSLLMELINSGRMESLSNTELRKRLTSWESRVESLQHQEEGLRQQQELTKDLFRRPDGSIRTILAQTGAGPEALALKGVRDLHSNLPLLKSREFENNLLLYMMSAISTETNHYQPLRREIETILELIEGGLE